MSSEHPDHDSDVERRALSATLPMEVPDEEIAGVRDVSFPIVMRGYDRAAVEAYVTRVNRIIAELQVSRSPQSAIRHALDQVSEETRGILERAHETADDITKRSQVQAAERVDQAEQEAREIVADAEERVRELQGDVDAIERERTRLIEDVRLIAEELQRVAGDAEPPPAPEDDTIAIDPGEPEQAESVDADPAPPPSDP